MLNPKDILQISQSKNPTWSPDGKSIAFLSNTTGSWQLHTNDRGLLTKGKNAINYAEFSPKKNEIIFLTDKNGNQRDQIFIYDLNTNKTHPLFNNPKVVHHFGGWSKDGECIAFSSNERNEHDFDIYIFDFRTGEKKLIFKPGGWCDSYGFSPDKKYLLAKVRHSTENYDLYLIHSVSNKITYLGRQAKFLKPQWLPDSSGFFIITDKNSNFLNTAFCNLKNIRYKTRIRWNVEDLALNPENNKLATVINKAGYSKLNFCPNFPSGVINDLHWNPQGNKLAINFSSYKHPDNIWIIDAQKNKSKPLLPIKNYSFIEPQLKAFKSFDNLRIPIFIYKKKTKIPRPAVIFIHGGPAAQFRPDFNFFIQFLALSGYIILAPNIRGSNGYGKRYLALDDQEKRFDTIKDLESLHQWISHKPNIDKKRIALLGRSYGGYMVLAGLAFLPKLWTAGVCISGIADFISYIKNTASWRRALREEEYGSDQKLLKKLSPIHQAKNIHVPLLLIYGANDARVPISEAKNMANKLGNLAQLAIYADEGHIFQKRKNEIDTLFKTSTFLKKCFK